VGCGEVDKHVSERFTDDKLRFPCLLECQKCNIHFSHQCLHENSEDLNQQADRQEDKLLPIVLNCERVAAWNPFEPHTHSHSQQHTRSKLDSEGMLILLACLSRSSLRLLALLLSTPQIM
jgi:hypothetical protein